MATITDLKIAINTIIEGISIIEQTTINAIQYNHEIQYSFFQMQTLSEMINDMLFYLNNVFLFH